MELPLAASPVFANFHRASIFALQAAAQMVPSAVSEPLSANAQNAHNGNDEGSYRKPLKLSGALNRFNFEETTPVIGREFIGVNIVDDLLNAENADELLRDLAITISQRGVVFFRAQSNLTNDLQKHFIQRLGELSGKPSTSTLHIHPVLNNTSEFGVDDAQISVISSMARKAFFRGQAAPQRAARRYDAARWHSDIQFEAAPADYTSLRLLALPSTGGDTLWASGYELYDRHSPAYRTFLEGLTATFVGDGFLQAERENPDRVRIYEGPRGSPLNVGRALQAVHPLVRTNPVTGWKSVYAIGSFPKFINELNHEESEGLLERLKEMLERSHDLQVRFKWRNPNDIAIWDNRCVHHSATFDYDGLGERYGNRAVGIGEAPYFDPKSVSRTEALRKEAAGVVDGQHENGTEKSEKVLV